MIKATDKRHAPTSFSTGTPAPPERTDMVMVKALRSFHDGSAMLTDASPPFNVMRHHAEELAAGGLVKILHANPKPAAPVPPVPAPGTGAPALAPPTAPVTHPADQPLDDTVEIEEDEVEVPDDQAQRAPHQNQQTASTVPALPGADPVRPDANRLPPAATTEAAPRGRRGRKAHQA